MTVTSSTALQGLRVLDLTTNYAAYAGRLLADLGAEVTRIEPPHGSVVRRLEPLVHLETGEDLSLAHAFLDAGKRSVVIDRHDGHGQDLFRGLVRDSEVLIHTPGSEESDSSSVEELKILNPRLIIASITAFGLTGPRAHCASGDLTVLAAGGLLSLGGYQDSEPLAVQGEQAQLAAGIFAAVAILAALCEREHAAPGVWIDVSGQECVAFALEDAVPDWYLGQRVRRRLGDIPREAGTGIYQCRDGYVSMVAGRLGTAKAFAALSRWIAESEVPGGSELLEPCWSDIEYRRSPEGIAVFGRLFGAFCCDRTKSHLYAEGQARQIAIAPVNTIADLFSDPQLLANRFFQPVFADVIGRDLLFPGPPYRLSRTPARIHAAAPATGQHNETLSVVRPAAALAEKL
jgi:benzylsuccinate CoA-transferase BbsE subunit